MNFLTAKWQHLILANYRIPPGVLSDVIPEGTVLDAFDGHVYISLVAFMFSRTRVLGIPVPLHVNFEEINLRFYVTPSHDSSRRGVCFIKEIVPRAAIPLIANNLFNENYVARAMSHTNGERHHRYAWTEERINSISGRIEEDPQIPALGSIYEFITEHYWGYSRGRHGTLEYRVEHPQWTCCQLCNAVIDVDYGGTYGNEFSFLSEQKPDCVLYATGSDVSVSFPRKLQQV